MTDEEKESIHDLANQFRQREKARIGGREFACRVSKLERHIDSLDEEKARDLAYKILHNPAQPELKGYLLTWFDGMGFGSYTLGQVLANIGEREVSAESIELLALW